MKNIAKGRKDVFVVKPEALTLVYDKAHPLYDPRVEDNPPESMIANYTTIGVLEPVIVRKNGLLCREGVKRNVKERKALRNPNPQIS